MLRLFYNYYYNNSNIEDGGEWQTILNCRVEACVFYGQFKPCSLLLVLMFSQISSHISLSILYNVQP